MDRLPPPSRATAMAAAVPPEPSPAPAANARAQVVAAPGPSYDLTRIRANLCVAGLTQGTLLGASFAAGNLLRARVSPAGRVFTGFLPALAGLASGPAEQALRDTTGAPPATYPLQPSLAHDAIPGVVFLIVNLGWYLSPHTPKPAPSSLAGALVTLGQATLGGAIAGALSEWRSQAERATAPASAEESPVPMGPYRKGVGHAVALLPMAFWTQTIVCLPLAGRPLPRWIGLTGSGVAALGWTGRRLFTPPEPQAGPETRRKAEDPIHFRGEIRVNAHGLPPGCA